MIDGSKTIKRPMIFVHVIGKCVTQHERQSALLTFMPFTGFMDHKMGEILHGGSPRRSLRPGTHTEALETEWAQSPINVVVPLDEMIDHHVEDAGPEVADGTHVRHLVADVVTAHVLHDLDLAFVVALADFASVGGGVGKEITQLSTVKSRANGFQRYQQITFVISGILL